jgi:hypothetical protein
MNAAGEKREAPHAAIGLIPLLTAPGVSPIMNAIPS